MGWRRTKMSLLVFVMCLVLLLQLKIYSRTWRAEGRVPAPLPEVAYYAPHTDPAKWPEGNSSEVPKAHSENGDRPRESTLSEEWGVVQSARVALLRSKCEKHHFFKQAVYRTQSILDVTRRFLYCPVEKVASTFMRRFMYSLTHNTHRRNITYPFSVNITQALKFKFAGWPVLGRNFSDLLSNKFLLVRDPYSRLFSAFVDKLLVPNSVYWKWWAIPAISRFRKSPSAQSLRCGHDVTFAEFVKFVIRSLHKRDAHVRPVKDLCAPCEMNFTMIGHSETLPEDFQFLTSSLNVTFGDSSARENLSIAVAKDAIADSTYSAFSMYGSLQTCLTKLELAQKLWTKMQIRGIISDEISFPLSEEGVAMVTNDTFVNLLEAARLKSHDKSAKLREQKVEAMQAAYDTVPIEDLNQLAEIYSLDFEFFGYDKHPAFLSRRASKGFQQRR